MNFAVTERLDATDQAPSIESYRYEPLCPAFEFLFELCPLWRSAKLDSDDGVPQRIKARLIVAILRIYRAYSSEMKNQVAACV